MDEEALNEAAPLIGPGEVEAAKGQNDEIHDQVRADSIEQPADNEMIAQEIQTKAGKAVDRGD